MEKKHSFFMKDKQNSDKIESLVDAFLSWTLQCCDTSKVESTTTPNFMNIPKGLLLYYSLVIQMN